MRLLIDESLSGRVARLLDDAGHDAIHVGDLDLLGVDDQHVMAAAKQSGRVAVSAANRGVSLRVSVDPPGGRTVLRCGCVLRATNIQDDPHPQE